MGKSIRIVFMGTPEFAVGSLKALNESSNTIAGVVTAPDKPAGRGKKLQFSAVKEYSLENNISPILQPANLKDKEFQKELAALNADLFVVVAFRMLPEAVFTMPPLGTINLHASLLPQYRGAAPINWAIINGETKTGVTSFFIEKEIDTGHIIMQDEVTVEPDDNAGSLHDKLMLAGSRLIVETVSAISGGFFEVTRQKTLACETELKPAPKIYKENCRVNWNKPPIEVHNFIRGLSPYPAAITELSGTSVPAVQLKIFESEPIPLSSCPHKPGTVIIEPPATLTIACKEGYINVLSLQQAGKARMDTGSFLRGFKNHHLYTLVS
ncbi:MAG: methionyl-tRNA formyltransferase [Bacteroidales bacterium]|nr:methionyl-tRNA formyltransferase [Bacteroidales bacterium]